MDPGKRHNVPYWGGRQSLGQELMRDQHAHNCAKKLSHNVANSIPAVYSPEPKKRECYRRIEMGS
jgi:hypothetical protein